MGYKGFSQVELRQPQRSTFDLSHDKRLSLQMGHLTPVLFQECIPSDSFNGRTEALIRLAPLLAPLYDQIQVYIHYFFVPYRLLWDEWETFITGGQFGPNDPDEPPPVVPQINIFEMLAFDPTYFQKSGLADYLGVPLLDDLPNPPTPVPDWTNCFIDTMPFLACSQIWYDYYRDRNFVSDDVFANHPLPAPSGAVPTLDVPTWIAEHGGMRIRNYRHDYFHSALPFAQRGVEVMVPSVINYMDASRTIDSGTGLGVDGGLFGFTPGGGQIGTLGIGTTDEGRIENLDSVGPLVNDFRTAYALQVWLERNAVGGSRYTESIQAHFGVRPQDSRLQRAEYIGGGMLPIKISEVVSMAQALDIDLEVPVPQGTLTGYGVSYSNNASFNYFCPEHGCIVGFMSIINPPSYHQGLPRYFKRRTFLDYPFPTFAKLGEQEVYDFEIYAAAENFTDPAAGETWNVFGYQSRYSDWKTGRNTSHGDFHDTLLFWSLASDFGVTPVLSQAFNEFNVNIEDRIFAVPAVDNFWAYVHNKVFVRRALPYFGTPNNLNFQ